MADVKLKKTIADGQSPSGNEVMSNFVALVQPVNGELDENNFRPDSLVEHIPITGYINFMNSGDVARATIKMPMSGKITYWQVASRSVISSGDIELYIDGVLVSDLVPVNDETTYGEELTNKYFKKNSIITIVDETYGAWDTTFALEVEVSHG